MTKQELNRDIKRLKAKYKTLQNTDNDIFFKSLPEIEKEFIRLYYADKDAQYMNYENFKFMYRLNLSRRFIPLHNFGAYIEI